VVLALILFHRQLELTDGLVEDSASEIIENINNYISIENWTASLNNEKIDHELFC
jgi:hypothetical protein